MKKNEIENIVSAHFKTMHKHFPELQNGFNNEEIVYFRKEVKKLKAFFHLLDMYSINDSTFQIPVKMKTLYGYTGIIRNLQQQLVNLNSWFRNPAGMMLPSYTMKLKNEIGSWKTITKEFIDEYHNFFEDEEKIYPNIPARLRSSAIKKFVQYNSYEIERHLGRITDDESLHSIRKLLEDVYYNIRYLPDYIALMPGGLRQQQELYSFIEQLSVFRDKCIAFTLLKTWYTDAGGSDKLLAENIIEAWTVQKKQLKEGIIYRLSLIPVKPLIKRFLEIPVRT